MEKISPKLHLSYRKIVITVKVHFDTDSPIDAEISGAILNSLRDQICLIDETGRICFINQEWNQFAILNGGTLSRCGIGANYLQECEKEPAVYEGLQEILAGASDGFRFEYPCHSPSINRWFLMQATPLRTNEKATSGVVIRHVNITKQKMLELQLKEYAEKDPLTSLFNRRFFEKQLTSEVNAAVQHGTHLALLYIDVDNFKDINDAYGHPAGDRVLEKLGLQIKEITRSADTAARIGGDEFAVLLPDADQSELELLANRLIQNIQQLKIQEQDHPIDVTVSIGGKSFIGDLSLISMAECADKALYLAKDKGKNQVVII